MRLIDADALGKTDRPVRKLMMFGGEYVYTQTEIDRAPTIDAVPVVRCGKCSDWKRTYRRREPTKLGYCSRRNCWMFEKEFCSSGTPREEKPNATD